MSSIIQRAACRSIHRRNADLVSLGGRGLGGLGAGVGVAVAGPTGASSSACRYIIHDAAKALQTSLSSSTTAIPTVCRPSSPSSHLLSSASPLPFSFLFSQATASFSSTPLGSCHFDADVPPSIGLCAFNGVVVTTEGIASTSTIGSMLARGMHVFTTWVFDDDR